MAACSSLPRGAQGQALSSALWGQCQDPRARHGAGTGEGQGKVLHPEVVGHWDRLPRAVVMAPSLSELKMRLDNTLRHTV